MTATTKTRKPLARGEQRPTAITGSTVVVYAQRGDVQGVRIWAEQGGQAVEGWDMTYPTAAEAVAERDRAVVAFEAHKTWQGIERRANKLGIIIQEQEGRKARRMCNHEVLDAATAEADALMPLGLAAVIRNAHQPIAA